MVKKLDVLSLLDSGHRNKDCRKLHLQVVGRTAFKGNDDSLYGSSLCFVSCHCKAKLKREVVGDEDFSNWAEEVMPWLEFHLSVRGNVGG